MRRAQVTLASKKVAMFRPILEFLMAKQPAAAKEWSKEAALLHKSNVHTPDCWAHLSTAQREAIVAKGLPAEVATLLNNFVSGDGEAATAAHKHKKILVAFGSHTGTAETYAKMLGTFASGHGFVPIVCSLNDAVAVLRDNETTKQIDTMLVVASTCGTGEFTSNSKGFYKELESGALSSAVKGLRYSVMGLGNSTNDNFNAVAKKIDKQLRDAGATSFLRMQLSCELQPSGHDSTFRTWKSAIWASLGGEGASTEIPCIYDVVPVLKKDTAVHRPHYYNAHVQSNARLSADKFVPESHQLVFTVPMRVQEEEVGRRVRFTDQVQVQPLNSRSAAERAAKLLGLGLNDYVEVNPRAGAAHSFFDGHKMTVEQVLREIVDLSAAPSRTVLETLAAACTADAAQRATLEELANDLSANSPYDKLVNEGFTILDVLERFSAVKLNLAQLLSVAPHIAPRTYSLARDNTNWLAEEFEIVYNVPTKARHTGLCTSMMADLTAGDNMLIRFIPDAITLPKNSSNIVIMTLGSGVGSARALLQHRQLAKSKGEAVGKAVLFYGFRNTGKDQLFRAEFDKMHAEGLVDMRYVPSRDVEGKFVTPMDAVDRSVTDFLGTKGEFVYCGLGGSVPLKVESALQRVGVDVAALRSTGRYHEEYFTADQDVENLLKEAGAADQGTLLGRMGNCDMFCFQCEQTFKNRGCNKIGVCGKTPRVAALQDLTIHAAKLLSFYASRLRALGAPDSDRINHLTLYALFTTLTNVNFDDTRFVVLMGDLHRAIAETKANYEKVCASKGVQPDEVKATTLPAVLPDADGLVELGRQVGVLRRFSDPASQSAAGVTEMLVYGLKGLAAYTDHALMNKREDPAIYEYMHRALSFMLSEDNLDLGKGLALALECGKVNVAAMSLLYNSNKTLGVPEPTVVPVKPRKAKCILVSGHDLIILKGLLEKTEPLGIDVYTHGEMLPAHAYPLLKKHKNLAGHFGGAWMRQSIEFPHFPGAILMTTNCLTEPQESYGPRLFTCAAVGWKGYPHIGNTMADIDFAPLIKGAQEAPGFGDEAAFAYPDPVGQKRPASLTVGFGHETVLSVAPTVIEAIKKGLITRFFVVGGCDGFEGQRSYYTDLVSQLPPTAVVLTVGCGKFRLNHLDLGTIGDTGIPRILDMGQCNDSFSAVQVALALADVLKCQVSDLPLSIVLSWFEQKAIAVLLSCLHLGLKPIHVGPSLPAFLTPEVLDVLVKNFGIRPLGDPAEDLKVMLAAKGAS